MRLILDPAEDVAHGDWLRTVPGAYEWWYFDALSESGEWALTCIWFLGNPFSPYYRLASQGRAADPYIHNALFFALYRYGQLYAYHFTQFKPESVCADEISPAMLRFGPNQLSSGMGRYELHLADVNANGRSLQAQLSFEAPVVHARSAETDASPDDHCWLPTAPSCRVLAELTLGEPHNFGKERITFHGHGYHDHNWGTLPFAAQIRDWYWARVDLGEEAALVLYHVDYRHARSVSHLLRFEGGQLVAHDAQAEIRLGRPRWNGFGTLYATELRVRSNEFTATVHLRRRLDSAPFYIRTLCDAEVRLDGNVLRGRGFGEYFRPRMLSWPLVASATKARIVTR